MVWTADLVAGRFDSTQELADESITSARTYMEELDNFLDSLIVPLTDDVEDVEFPEILPIDFSARPSFIAQLESFPTFGGDTPAAPSLTAVPASTIDEPDIEVQADPEAMTYTPGAYNSDIRTDLFAKLLNDIRYGGTGLSPTVEEDIYDRGRERQRIENERLYRETEDRFTATGFGLPSGALASSLQSISVEISGKNDQLSREIAINQADLEQKNIQFSVDQAVKVEAILIDFYNAQENRLFDLAKSIAQSAIEVYNAITANQLAKLERYKTDAEVYKIKVESAVQENEVLIKQYDVEVKSFVAQIELEIKNAQLQVEAFKTEAMVFEVETNATSAYYDTLIKENSLEVEAFVAKINKQIAILESSTSAYTAIKSLQEKGFESIMNVNAQLAASAMNAVNVSASQRISSSTTTSN